MRIPTLLLFFLLPLILTAQSPKREFRGVWIATVKNIDWPSKADRYSEYHQEEFIELLDHLESHGINAIIVQIRPMGDAFYPSVYEPWSEFLTGTQGKRPEPYFDPIEFMIGEAHKRGIEFHAWFNPFRADMNWFEGKERAPKHISNRHPEWCRPYGNHLYLDPGLPQVRSYVNAVVVEVAKRYDIDAVHFDDYFYPYRVAGEQFPDSSTFLDYGQPLSDIEDWRRGNIDRFIQGIRDSLLDINSDIRLGISPFGVWRNQDRDPLGSASRAGITSYDDLYADIRKWLEEGWIDYVAPQLYFSIGYPPADFAKLADWWCDNSFGRSLYIGHALYKIGNNADQNWDEANQLGRQIDLTRSKKEIEGSIMFSAKWFYQNPLGFADTLLKNHYARPALIQSDPFKNANPPGAPTALYCGSEKQGMRFQWEAADYGDKPAYYLVYRSTGKEFPARQVQYAWKKLGPEAESFLDNQTRFFRKYHYLVTAVDRDHNESQASEILSKRRWTGLFQ